MNDSVATRLCSACGLCCNGGLFDLVNLQPGESARALAVLGLKMKRDQGGHWFRQPCSAHGNGGCAIYESRPARCRLFECQLLRKVTAKELSEAEALATIAEALELIARINQLIDQIAETNPKRSLAQRIANALTTDETTALHQELVTLRNDYDTLTKREFRDRCAE